MTQDQIADIYQKANGWSPRAYPNTMAELEAFAKLVADKATDEANARANASWTLMCKKMVEAEREACAGIVDEWAKGLSGEPEMFEIAKEIRARGQLQGDQKPG
jgi:hypothetical protein